MFALIVEQLMNIVATKILTPHDRMRYALTHVNKAEESWSARELFFLVKKFFPMETRPSISRASATLCTCGEFSISGRRYKTKALKPVQREEVMRKDVTVFQPSPPDQTVSLSGANPIARP